MQNDYQLSPLRQSIRQFNAGAIEFHLSRLLKQTGSPACSPRLRAEIYLEAVKAYRVLDRLNDAVRYADLTIANIPAESLDVLSALKRIRSLLFLDTGDGASARNLIDETDGLELVLDKGKTLISRRDEEVQVETWLVSMEIALAARDAEAAQNFFDKAVTRLGTEEAELRRKRINPRERKSYEQYYHDLGQLLSLYGLTLGLINGDRQARAGLAELRRQVSDDNKVAAAAKKLPNVPLHSKLQCLLGDWSPDVHSKSPDGISLPEARRWAAFGNEEYFAPAIDSGKPSSEQFGDAASALVSIPDAAGSSPLPPAAFDHEKTEKALDITASALERMAGVLEQVESFLPNFKSYLKAGDSVQDFAGEGFGGHLLATDLYNFMQNFDALKFTGYLRLKWGKDLYKPLVVKGVLPEVVRCGEAHIYVCEGAAIDAVFQGQQTTNAVAVAQENFIILTRMCLSIGVEETRPDIYGYAVPEANVAARPRLLNVRVNDLLFITSDIESELAGVTTDESESAIELLSRNAGASGVLGGGESVREEKAEIKAEEKSENEAMETEAIQPRPPATETNDKLVVGDGDSSKDAADMDEMDLLNVAAAPLTNNGGREKEKPKGQIPSASESRAMDDILELI